MLVFLSFSNKFLLIYFYANILDEKIGKYYNYVLLFHKEFKCQNMMRRLKARNTEDKTGNNQKVEDAQQDDKEDMDLNAEEKDEDGIIDSAESVAKRILDEIEVEIKPWVIRNIMT